MDQIRHASLPLRLKNVFNPKGSGTIIYPSGSTSPSLKSLTLDSEDSEIKKEIPDSGFMLENGYHGEQQERRRPTAVTVKDFIILVNVVCNRNTKSQGFLAGVFNKLEENKMLVDLVTTSEGNVSLAMQSSDGTENQQRRLKGDLEKFGKVC